jgi:hypothetical protein
VRKQHPVLAIGELEILHAENPSILAYLRRYSVPGETGTAQAATDGRRAGDGGRTTQGDPAASTGHAGHARHAGSFGPAGSGGSLAAALASGSLTFSSQVIEIEGELPVGHDSGVLSSGADPSGASDTVQGRSDIVLCVHNLSRFPQPCELMLEQLAGKVPIELTGRVRFPRIGTLPYFVTLAPYGFFWFELVDDEDDDAG